MSYKADFSDEFLKTASKLKKKDKTTFKRLTLKIEEILKNPEHHKPIKGEMKGLRRAHIGSFVIVFKVEGEYVKFVAFKHHNKAYK
ncbi:type II toxin-antitoxin system mRNA interferase toxin, RelE/StbE family [Archaeoglobales archaeon]|nr:MAG: type II toxin-antitoxin system mRNA interferase toxin, RelE/StbE family [Archaeoglobales archaeon]